MEYLIKRYRYSSLNNQWEFIREAFVAKDIADPILEAPRQDVPACWRYQVYDQKGKQVGQIDTVNPNLFD